MFGKNSRGKSIETPEGKKGEGVRNDETGEIEKLSPAGTHTVALIRLDDGRRINLHLDRFGPQQIDHGYAVTVYGGQGGTVDSVIPFHYVKPGTENNRSALESITGVKLSETRYRQWSAELSGFEKGYQAGVKIGGHAGEIGFVMIRDRKTDEALKGIAIAFHNGSAMVADESTRLKMREAGMYWSRDAGSWVTAVTNDRAMGLMDRHPLQDAGYIAQLKREFAAGPEVKPEHVDRAGAEGRIHERNFQAEIDTSADAEKFGRASYNSFNVAVTRARHEAVVFTNSVPGLRKAVLSVDEKTSTIGNRLTAKTDALSEMLRRDTRAPSKPVEVIRQPEVKAFAKIDPGLELKR